MPTCRVRGMRNHYYYYYYYASVMPLVTIF